MASTIQENVNSYITLAAADLLFADRPEAALWAAFSTEQKTQGLLTAFTALNALRYAGRPTSRTQPAPWPRVNLRTPDDQYLNGTTVPADVQRAQCLEALTRLQDLAANERQRLQAQGVTSIRLGDLAETYTPRPAGQVIHSSEAYTLLVPYLLKRQ